MAFWCDFCYGLLVWPSGKEFWCSVMAFWLKGVSVRRDPSTRRPYQKAITDHFQPEGHNRRPLSTRRPPSIRRQLNQKATKPEGHNRRPHNPPARHPPRPAARHAGIASPKETYCKACWDTTRNACWDSTPLNRITDTCKNITLATTSLRPVINK